jgi:hypothetical protein
MIISFEVEMIAENRNLHEFVRQFPENGMKLLLENPLNVRDLLAITAVDLLEMVDFERLELVRTTFIKPDYRHVESDVVLTAPLKSRDGARSRRKVVVYILIEHQSEPRRLMPLSLLDYVVQIYRSQERQWARKHGSLSQAWLQPVLPLVFYTGTRPWESPGNLVDLVAMGQVFRRFIPPLEPLFVNLRELPAEVLETQGGFFGWVLRLLQERTAPARAFQRVLTGVIRHLERMPADERSRWLELLSYIHALVYHHRDTKEIPALQTTIEASVRTDDHRRELFDMGKSYAETLKEEGREQGEVRARRNTLLRLLRKRFGDLPAEIIERIGATNDIEQLDTWLDRVLTASSIEDMAI